MTEETKKQDDTTKTANESKRVTREFPFVLSEKDLADKAKRLGELAGQLDEAQRKLDAAKGHFKGVESEIAVERGIHIEAIRAGKEYRTVECDEVKDYVHGRVYWVPVDAKEGTPVLGERPLTNDERQLRMRLDEKAAKEAKPGAEYEDAAKNEEETTDLVTDAQVQALKQEQAQA